MTAPYTGPEASEDDARNFLPGGAESLSWDEDQSETCALCNGDGRAEPYRNGILVTCPECDGEGVVASGHTYLWCD